jgi:hypothetical protein
MGARRREPRDERNSSFDPEPVFEELRPGLETGARAEGGVAEGHHRLSPRDSKDIPQEPLAKRIRRAPKGD